MGGRRFEARACGARNSYALSGSLKPSRLLGHNSAQQDAGPLRSWCPMGVFGLRMICSFSRCLIDLGVGLHHQKSG